ncbi:hypothetical protein VaNZ11_009631 [Volvox africanus]|uniref:Uncharacterized protein n=1 Tax=Volvox africanus TaxID=51714 RepID=A0ABQ5S7R5_9CHLO|nr:hypothetical protein VaNZ11_009631 [Volvox africanus]
MSQHAGGPNSSSWDFTAASLRAQNRIEPSCPEEHQRIVLNKAYQKAIASLESAQAVIAGVSSGLYDVEASQTDVSARLSGRSTMRYTGRKRKLSPCVYDYSDSCFTGAKADTPTQDLLPASRSELRHHQLQAVRWLASLELQGAGGVLADELEQDRRAEVAGLLSHLLMLGPYPSFSEMNNGGSTRVAGGGGSQVCMLLAPSGSLSGWAEVISEHVDVRVHVHDGTADSMAALQAECTALAHRPGAAASTPGPVARTSQLPPHTGPQTGVSSAAAASRRTAAGAPLLSSSSSAAGVYPPPRHPLTVAEAVTAAAASPLMRPNVGGSGLQHRSLLVVLAPLEHLHRDAGLLTQIPQRLLVVDLAPPEGNDGEGGSGSVCAGRGTGSGDDSDGVGKTLFRIFSGDFEVGPDSDSGSHHTAQFCSGPMGRWGQGMVLDSYHHLHLLTRMPAACRVLLSAGIPEPAGDGIWLLLQLLAPRVHRPLWEAVSELQHGLVASGPLGAQCKENVLSEIHGRLWGLLRPLTLHRRARDVDLVTMRVTATNLNLYDHFSAARTDGA